MNPPILFHNPIRFLFRWLPFSLVCLVCITDAEARNFRVSMMPNGSVFNCLTCHRSAGGGGPTNPFGTAVRSLVSPNGRQQFWTPALAALDSDGDGFTNGEELGDPDGDGTAIPRTTVTHPGDPNSKPAIVNLPPDLDPFTDAEAIIGLLFEKQIVANDPEEGDLAYNLVTGPDWITVNADGLISGIPPEGSASEESVEIEVSDIEQETVTGSFLLKVRASFAGWQALHFDLPTDAAQATIDADPDGDFIPNAIEYALGLNPNHQDPSPLTPVLGESGRLQITLDVRNDDPDLNFFADFTSALPFSDSQNISRTDIKPEPGNGKTEVTLTDEPIFSEVGTRFIRLGVEF